LAKVSEKIKLLMLVQNMGGKISFDFKKKATRKMAPDGTEFSIKEVIVQNETARIIVFPVNNPGRALSIDGGTMISAIECGSKVLVF